MLAVNPRGFILKETIHKQGDKLNKKTSERLCTLDAAKLQWFHDDAELQAGKTVLGSIELRFIYNVIKSYQDHNDRPAFMLGATMWTDKKGEEKSKREFFFSCHDVLTRDKWMIAIEFLKTKAVYDAYSAKNSNVNFTLKAHDQEEEQNHEEEHRVDMASLLYDFGPNLKSETRAYVQKNPSSLAANMGNMAQALATMQKSESFSKNPRMSVLRQQSTAENRESKLSAAELVPKLRLLYTTGIIAFTQHVATAAVKMTVKQQAARLGNLTDRQALILSDRVANELQDSPDRSDSRSRQSLSSAHHARQQLTETLGHGNDIRRNRKRERIDVKEGRRSSSISADNVHKGTPETVLSATHQIQEDLNESGSSENEMDQRLNQHGSVGSDVLNSGSNGRGGAGRLSQEVNENKLAQLKLTQSSDTGRKGLSMANLKNSENSRTSSHSPLTSQTAQNTLSAQPN